MKPHEELERREFRLMQKQSREPLVGFVVGTHRIKGDQPEEMLIDVQVLTNAGMRLIERIPVPLLAFQNGDKVAVSVTKI